MTYTSPGRPQQHVLCEWEGFLAIHRYEDLWLILDVIEGFRPARVVELGTHQGGLAAFFATAVARWGGQVLSVDRVQDPGIAAGLLARYRNLTLHTADLLAAAPDPTVLRWVAEPQTLLYCDNGDKMRELTSYGAALARPGLLGTHDYGTEVDPAAIEPRLDAHGFTPWRHADFAALANPDYWDSLTRFWRRDS